MQRFFSTDNHQWNRISLQIWQQRLQFISCWCTTTMSKMSNFEMSQGKHFPIDFPADGLATRLQSRSADLKFQTGMNPNFVRKRKDDTIRGPYEPSAPKIYRPSGKKIGLGLIGHDSMPWPISHRSVPDHEINICFSYCRKFIASSC